jgi:hypothetical protein
VHQKEGIMRRAFLLLVILIGGVIGGVIAGPAMPAA